MNEWFAVTGLAMMLLVLFAKMWNVTKFGRGYATFLIWATFIISAFGWLMVFVGFTSTIYLEHEATITNAANQVTTIVDTDNSYILFSIFQTIANLLIVLNVMLTIFEALTLWQALPIMAKQGIQSADLRRK